LARRAEESRSILSIIARGFGLAHVQGPTLHITRTDGGFLPTRLLAVWSFWCLWPMPWAGPNQKGRYQDYFARVGMHYRKCVTGGEPWLRTPLLCIPLVHEPINKSECRP
jgi:hypothetical protein